MASYNTNIHHRKSIRLQGYDYSQSGLYFITICVKDHKCLFGKIVKENSLGTMVLNDAGKIADDCWLEIPIHFPKPINKYQKIIPHSIGSIVRGYKIGVTKWFKTHTDYRFAWQRNYYEIIIRSEKSYRRICEYIINNPKNWCEDDFFT